MAGTWQPLKNNPPANVETMLLLTDGSVIAHETSTAFWHRLRPDAAGDYMQGTWSAVAPMPNNSLIPPGTAGRPMHRFTLLPPFSATARCSLPVANIIFEGGDLHEATTDLGGELGVTDAVSGPVVLDLKG